MKQLVLAAALLGAAITPAFAEHHEEAIDLPMDQNDRAPHEGEGTPVDVGTIGAATLASGTETTPAEEHQEHHGH